MRALPVDFNFVNDSYLPADVIDLVFFENYLNSLLDNFEDPIRDLARDVLLNRGKRIRPLLVHSCGGDDPKIENDLLKASAIIEIVHVATLVHDDVIDSADLRRGKKTIHSQFGEHTAILLGDALFSYALELASEFPNSTVCRIVSSATRKTCSGEISQNFMKGDFQMSPDLYLKIIQEKTGELFRASCYLGSFLSGFDKNDCETLGNFGSSLGINYQIYDDLVDIFGNRSEFGKNLGSDLKSHKFTLPIIKLFESVSSSEKSQLKSHILKNMHNDDFVNYVGVLLAEYNIYDICFCELNDRISSAKALALNFSNRLISSRLLKFLSSFETKVTELSSKSVSNFVAVN